MSSQCHFLPGLASVLLVLSGCGGGGGGSSAGGPPDPPTPPSSTVSTARFVSDPGDFVGDGVSHSYTKANADFHVTAQDGLLYIEILGNEKLRGEFQMPAGYTTIVPGTYGGLTRYQFHDPVIGGLNWVQDGRSCGGVAGSVTINKATYEAGSLTEIDLEFTQFCDGTSFALRGDIYWNARDTTKPPGPAAIPAGLWQPAAGATPATGTYVYLESQPDDYIGAGATYLYTKVDATIAVGVENARLAVLVRGDKWWDGVFEGMSSLSQLQVGYYGSLRAHAERNPAAGGLDWSGESRGCGSLSGWFVVDSITYDSGILTALDIRFEQRCVNRTGVLHGKIHWEASDTSAPPGPTEPPAGLWQPAAGVTPATGNYVYLESEPGDYIGQGQTYLYTQANAEFSIYNSSYYLHLQVTGNQTWEGQFQTMTSIPRYEVGYYGNLPSAIYFNPAVGGLSWMKDLRTCPQSSGWFVVDAVTYDGETLKSIDLRFEQRCGSDSGRLHGKIHWTPDDTTVPPGPTAPPPDLWQPSAGVTPASGNYVYLDSQPDAFVGGGQQYLYTPENAQFILSAEGAAMMMRVNADMRWSGEFQGMNSVARFEPGYYGDLRGFPYINPTKGGMSWGGGGRGCVHTGWFVVDDVVYSGTTLVSIDLRFGQVCDGHTDALHGKIHWSQ